jgi:hypothetical protein
LFNWRSVTRTAAGTLGLLGAATLLYSGAPVGPRCTAQSTVVSNFNGTPIAGGNFIWFNANFSAKGIPSGGARVLFQNSTIQFTADQTYTLNVPSAQVTFDPLATCATVSFDPWTNRFNTTVPISGSDEIFLTGFAFPVPDSFAAVNGKITGPVVWQGTLGTDTPGVSVSWKWGAAVYTTFSADYNALQILPTHSNACVPAGGDHAGTPEGFAPSGIAFKRFVVGGARGGGGSNFTGSWSGTATTGINSCS